MPLNIYYLYTKKAKINGVQGCNILKPDACELHLFFDISMQFNLINPWYVDIQFKVLEIKLFNFLLSTRVYNGF